MFLTHASNSCIIVMRFSWFRVSLLSSCKEIQMKCRSEKRVSHKNALSSVQTKQKNFCSSSMQCNDRKGGCKPRIGMIEKFRFATLEPGTPERW